MYLRQQKGCKTILIKLGGNLDLGLEHVQVQILPVDCGRFASQYFVASCGRGMVICIEGRDDVSDQDFLAHIPDRAVANIV